MRFSSTAVGHIVALCTIILWGATFISTKLLLVDFTPLEVLFFRFIIGYVALFFVCPHFLKTTGLRQEVIFMGAGLSGITLYFLLENIALNHTFASNVGVIVAISPFCTALLAQVLLRGKGYANERLSLCFFVGFVVAISGIALIAFNGSVNLHLNPLGDLLAAGAAVAWAFYSISMRRIGEMRYHTALCTRRVFFYGLVFMLPVVWMQGISLETQRFLKPINYGNIVFLGVGASAICFVTWNFAVKTLGVVQASAYIYLVPVVTVVAAALILHETITPMAVVGTALTLVGLLISEMKGLKGLWSSRCKPTLSLTAVKNSDTR